MRRRTGEWILAGLLTLGTAAWLGAHATSPRPEDLEIQVEVRELPPIPSQQQLVEVKVRWRWLRQPRGLFPAVQAVGFSYDRAHWGPYGGGSFIGADHLEHLRFREGELRTDLLNEVPAGQDGERTVQFFAHGTNARYFSQALPIKVHFYHRPRGPFRLPDAGWLKSVGGIYPLGQ